MRARMTVTGESAGQVDRQGQMIERTGMTAGIDWVPPGTAPEVVGLVADVRRFSVSEGPGVRSTVLLKGCPMRCVWCDRPSYRPLRPGLEVGGEACRSCDEPVEDGLTDDGPCLRCEQAPQDVMKVVGQRRTAGEVMELLARDHRLYLATGGGMTISGGEPLYQPEFATTLLRAARQRGWHTAIDTSGQVATPLFEEALPLTDLVIFELKETDLQLHQRWTGTQLEPVIRNLVRAAVSQSELWVRLPVVPFANDRDDHWEQAGSLLADLPGPPAVHLMPYYFGKTGMVRATDADASGRLVGPTEDRLEQIVAVLEGYGLDVHRP